MTQRRIRLADLSSEPVIVELGDRAYEVRATTRSVQQKLSKSLRDLNEAENDAETDPDKAMTALAGCLDVLLAPQGDAPAAKKVIMDAWKADQLSVSQVSGLFQNIQEAATARPT